MYTADDLHATNSNRLSGLQLQLSTTSAETSPSRVIGRGSNVDLTSLKLSAAVKRQTRLLLGSLTAKFLQSGDRIKAGSAAKNEAREFQSTFNHAMR